jgi:hypothetical protein
MRRMLERARRDAGGQSERGVVGDRERFVVVLHAHDACNGAEHFLAVDAHRRRRFGDERGRHVEAFGPALQSLAARGNLAAFRLRDLDVLEVLVELALIDDGADVGAGLERIVDG